MSVEKKINMFNIKSVNTEFIIIIHNHYTTISGLVKKNGGSHSITFPSYSDCEKFNSYLINKICKKLLGNTIEKIGNIENHEYLHRDGDIIRKFIFETESDIIKEKSINQLSIDNNEYLEKDISETDPINPLSIDNNEYPDQEYLDQEYLDQQDGNIIRKFICKFISEIESINIIENSINSIIKIIDNKKFVITAFNDNIFITNIEDNFTIYHSYDNDTDIFRTTAVIYPPSQYNFSQIQKEVFAQHRSDVQKALKLNYVPVKINDEPLKTNVEPVKTNNDGCISQ